MSLPTSIRRRSFCELVYWRVARSDMTSSLVILRLVMISVYSLCRYCSCCSILAALIWLSVLIDSKTSTLDYNILIFSSASFSFTSNSSFSPVVFSKFMVCSAISLCNFSSLLVILRLSCCSSRNDYSFFCSYRTTSAFCLSISSQKN